MVAEGAGAVSVAAAMTNKVDIAGKNVVCVVSGGNVDIGILDRAISKGLQANGRQIDFSVIMADKPGQLTQLIEVIAETGANILEVNHNRRAKGVAVSNCVVDVVVETRNSAHSEELLYALKARGYEVK
jgi:threonine dehydratase